MVHDIISECFLEHLDGFYSIFFLKFETKFDADFFSSLISVTPVVVKLTGSLKLTSQNCTELKSVSSQLAVVSPLIHKAYCWPHQAAEGYMTTLKFPELLGSTTYI